MRWLGGALLGSEVELLELYIPVQRVGWPAMGPCEAALEAKGVCSNHRTVAFPITDHPTHAKTTRFESNQRLTSVWAGSPDNVRSVESKAILSLFRRGDSNGIHRQGALIRYVNHEALLPCTGERSDAKWNRRFERERRITARLGCAGGSEDSDGYDDEMLAHRNSSEGVMCTRAT
jgi:hypothetical protein